MKKEKEEQSKLYDLLPILFCGLSIPLSMFMWLGNLAFLKLIASSSDFESNAISPTRWLFSTFAPISLMLYALKRKAVSKSGAVLGLIFAIIISLANHAFFMSLVIFFFTSSRATKFRGHMKRKFEKDFKEGGQRNWTQVLCNGGMATQLAILYLLDCGSGEQPINFSENYRSSWLSIAVLSSFACCCGDTWASELGSVLGKSDPFLITSWKKVPRGTNGGVSLIGLLVSFLGGITVGLGYYLTIKCVIPSHLLYINPPQWPIIIYGGIAGLFGSIVDSIIGATVQYSGIDENGKIVDRPDENTRYISGLRILDNHSVNLISSILTGITIPMIALRFWPIV